ncbi:DNL zinc finger protein [Teratosphaeria destructans]|uniref:DNL zinc finger protein n=1 Tax=Teratosphaeria destructans TaxID=418781 RepID=A0A9W7T375_9PEZI|nr:DNL zinc finger protein [Teratosphaeria destructans]
MKSAFSLRSAARQAFHHAPIRLPQAQRCHHTRQSPILLLKPRTAVNHCQHHLHQARRESTATPPTSTAQPSPKPLTDNAGDTPPQTPEEIAARKAQEPAYEMTFTCRKCLSRSSHRITKQAYHFGTTLVTCPGCKNRHLISDHLKIFSDRGITLEDILKEKGQYLKKGRLGEDGDVEFYPDDAEEAIRTGKGRAG